MKKYRIEKSPLDFVNKLLHQTGGEIIDCIEGCLLDDLLIATRRGYLAIMETYQNANSSIYTMYFDKDIETIYNVFTRKQA